MNLRPAPATSPLPGPSRAASKERAAATPTPGHPIKHHVAGARHSAPRTEIRLGARHGGGTGERGIPTTRTERASPDDLTTPQPGLLPRRAMIRAGQHGAKVVRPAGRSTLTPRRPAPPIGGYQEAGGNQTPGQAIPMSARS